MTPCSKCFEGKRNGHVISIICMDEGRPSFKKLVTPKICGNCSMSGIASQTPQKPHTELPKIGPLGTIIYARTGWEVPPCPPGYQRKTSDLSSDDAWILEPIGTVCKHLELTPAETGFCGYHRIARRCQLVESFVGQRTCETCLKKEELDARTT